MKMSKHIAPKFLSRTFTCPHCGAVTQQIWSDDLSPKRDLSSHKTPSCRISVCVVCKQYSIWVGLVDNSQTMVYPTGGTAPPPHPEMWKNAKDTYEQARSIAELSPCASAALLRKALEQILMQYGKTKGKETSHLREMLKSLKEDIPEDIYMNLETVKLAGDKSIHPGEIDMKDFPKITAALFSVVNDIFEELVARPAKNRKLYKETVSAITQKTKQ